MWKGIIIVIIIILVLFLFCALKLSSISDDNDNKKQICFTDFLFCIILKTSMEEVMNKTFAIIEIGSNNTKTHVYENDKVLYDTTTTIEFKKNYAKEGKILEEDLNKLYKVIEQVKNYTDNIYVYGCSIFRKLSEEELNTINKDF